MSNVKGYYYFWFAILETIELYANEREMSNRIMSVEMQNVKSMNCK